MKLIRPYLEQHEIYISLPCEQFLQQIEISRAFLRAKHMGAKRGKFQNPVQVVHIQVVLFRLVRIHSFKAFERVSESF